MALSNYTKLTPLLVLFFFFSCKKEKYNFQNEIVLKNWSNETIKKARLMQYEKNSNFKKLEAIDTCFLISTYPIKTEESDKKDILLSFKNFNILPIDKDFIIKINNSEYKIDKIIWSSDTVMAGMVKRVSYNVDFFNINNIKYESCQGQFCIPQDVK